MKKLTGIGMGKLGLLVGILFLGFLNIIPPINAQLSVLILMVIGFVIKLKF
jgi:hypothetical protein